MIPSLSRQRGLRRLVRPLASSAFVVFTFVAGAALWLTALAAHDRADAAAAGSLGHDHGDFAARAQAGIILRPTSDVAPTQGDIDAGAAFAAATWAGISKYQDKSAAVAAGYKPDGPAIGPKRHFSNAAYKKDGRTLDPTRPEMLVYGVKGETYVLLGAVYTMEKAGDPGPGFAGSIARWHAHNGCVTVVPPAFGLVSPYGTCPLASVDVTLPEMIHVWTVDNPGGPYAQDLADSFVRHLLNAAQP